jgi:hypothetical protein
MKMDLTFDEIASKFAIDNKKERIQETEDFFRWILMIVFFIMVIGIYFKSLWVIPPQKTLTPGYIPSIEFPAEYPLIFNPIILNE